MFQVYVLESDGDALGLQLVFELNRSVAGVYCNGNKP